MTLSVTPVVDTLVRNLAWTLLYSWLD